MRNRGEYEFPAGIAKVGNACFIEVERVITPEGNYSIYQAGAKKPEDIEEAQIELYYQGAVLDTQGHMTSTTRVGSISLELDEGVIVERFAAIKFFRGPVGITPEITVFPNSENN